MKKNNKYHLHWVSLHKLKKKSHKIKRKGVLTLEIISDFTISNTSLIYSIKSTPLHQKKKTKKNNTK
jgi:hypothetical protein